MRKPDNVIDTPVRPLSDASDNVIGTDNVTGTPDTDNVVNKGGRPTKYSPAHPKNVYHLALLGATDKDIAFGLGVSESTINNWKLQHPDFELQLSRGKMEADAKVAHALYRRALGYSHRAVKIFCNSKTSEITQVPYIERYPPDPTSIIFWLKNRRPDLFRDRFHLKHTGDPNEPIAINNIGNLSDQELIARAEESLGKLREGG